jgi:UDP-N-acetyl-D-mannosaminuronic acid dehydrogenase/UDP-N-acetyl-D-glucosamine dehydrogenase
VVARRLADLGAELQAVDPLIAPAEVPPGVQLVECTPATVGEADVVVVLADHDDVDWELLESHAERVVDTRNRLGSPAVDRL